MRFTPLEEIVIVATAYNEMQARKGARDLLRLPEPKPYWPWKPTLVLMAIVVAVVNWMLVCTPDVWSRRAPGAVVAAFDFYFVPMALCLCRSVMTSFPTKLKR